MAAEQPDAASGEAREAYPFQVADAPPKWMDPARFREIVSGKRQGVGASLIRAGLRLAAIPYAAVVGARNRLWDQGKIEICRAAVPVVSVGNLTLGGTGKTPMVAYLARWFREQGRRVAIVSRGYGAGEDGRNDEALELEQQLPDVPHVQNANRVDAARVATEELECDLVIMDDGFQHRRLHRDLDLVLIDALEPFGHGHIFPRGTLREPTSSLARADAVVLSRSDMISPRERAALQQRVRLLAPRAIWAEVMHAPRALLSAAGQESACQELAGRRVAAFCGLGNPAGFRHTLEQCGYEVAAWRAFADHYRYRREDVAELANWAETAQVEAVVCTHKDLVKLSVESLGGIPLRAVAVGIEFRLGAEALAERLGEVLRMQQAAGGESAVEE